MNTMISYPRHKKTHLIKLLQLLLIHYTQLLTSKRAKEEVTLQSPAFAGLVDEACAEGIRGFVGTSQRCGGPEVGRAGCGCEMLRGVGE